MPHFTRAHGFNPSCLIALCRSPRAHASASALMLAASILGISSHFSSPAHAQTAETPPAPISCQLSPKPNTLWSLTQCCVKNTKSNPSCVLSDPKDQYVIIKDNAPQKPDAYLLMPSVRITGIEDPKIFLPSFINMWAEADDRAKQYPGQPPQRIGMALNSIDGRTQNQLHIHISCIRDDVRSKLDATAVPAYPGKPISLPLPPNGNTYVAVTVASLTGSNSPFNVIQSIPGVKDHMELQSIAVVATKSPNEYYVLNTSAHGTNHGAAEELLNETCE